MSEQLDHIPASPPKVQRVSIDGGSSSDGAIVDGVSSSIKATVKDYSNSNPLAVVTVDTNGDYVSGSGGTQYTEDAAAAANPVGTALNLIRADSLAGLTTTDGDNVAARGTDKGEVYVKHVDTIAVTQSGTWDEIGINDSGNSITVDNAGLTELAAAIDTEVQVDIVGALPAGTNAIGKLAANSGVDIGDVDITSIAAGDNNIGNVDIVTMPGVVGTVADDATTPGNPVMIGAKAVETDGTDPTSVSAEDDVAILRTDRNRRLLVNSAHPNLWKVNENHASAQTNNQLKAAPGANLSLYITDIIISNGATAGTVKLVEDEGGTPADIAGPYYFGVNSGTSLHLTTPIRMTANKTLGFTSATVTTHSITVMGYIAP